MPLRRRRSHNQQLTEFERGRVVELREGRFSFRDIAERLGRNLTPPFDHLPYSPDLAPSGFHLFLKLKEFLDDKRFASDEELENAVITWLNEVAAQEYDMGILKLVDRYDKCLNVGGDYVEK
ncbi:hypothetical protein AVEN_25805-1 [Araneus ventricosus]|uniref:Histone-lysine N-methyltransferase SETMAR n=1 Tax=Araneus ventricosus TaxID=182803 RepID=A0A4Y2LJ24_ARAVE|nr:hypothetical protein AVEN_25805-1 [Araneus ventricosus]